MGVRRAKPKNFFETGGKVNEFNGCSLLLSNRLTTRYRKINIMTEQQHIVGPDQIFFSVTDDKGVITDSNSVFESISHYLREELLDSPHNIIRNPEMPGGAFRLMWDALESGKPFIAYVRNMAKDGLPYEVLSTVTPLEGGGYLSVRTRVSDPEFASKIWWLYGETRGKEDELLGEGKNRRETAEIGAQFINDKVSDHGFVDYEDVQRFLLPHEISIWEKNASNEVVAEGRLAPVSKAVSELRTEEENWSDRQDAMAELAAQLTSVGAKIQASLARTADLKTQADVWSGKLTPMEAIPLNVAVSLGSIVTEYVDDLQKRLQALRGSIEHVRPTIALARVQTHCLAAFVREVAEDSAGGRKVVSMKTLTSALTTEVEAMGKNVAQYGTNLSRCERRLQAVLSLIEIPQQMIMDWLKSVQEFGPSVDMPELISAVAGEIESSASMVDELNGLLGRLGTIEQKSPRHMLDLLHTVDAEVRKLQV